MKLDIPKELIEVPGRVRWWGLTLQQEFTVMSEPDRFGARVVKHEWRDVPHADN